jgi:hypothetical protein
VALNGRRSPGILRLTIAVAGAPDARDEHEAGPDPVDLLAVADGGEAGALGGERLVNQIDHRIPLKEWVGEHGFDGKSAPRAPHQEGALSVGAAARYLRPAALYAPVRRIWAATPAPFPGASTQFGQWFGVDGVAWCNIFVSYCFAQGAGYTICAGYKGAGVYAKGCTYVPTTEAWLRAAGMWIGRGTPQPGDIAIFNWDGGVPDHIGIARRTSAAGSSRPSRATPPSATTPTGGQVMRRLRYLSQVDGFGRVR